MENKINKTLNIEELKKEFQTLKKLKSILGINDDNVTKPGLWELCVAHNQKEIYLLIYMIDFIITLPKKVSNQFDLIIENMKNQKRYKELLIETQNLYDTDITFIMNKKQISEDLEFNYKFDRDFFNQIIYEICNEYINNDIMLDENNTVMNLYFLKKWLYTQDYGVMKNITENEIRIFNSIFEFGYTDEVKKSDINRIIKKFQNKTILQAIAMFYFYNSNSVVPLSPFRHRWQCTHFNNNQK